MFIEGEYWTKKASLSCQRDFEQLSFQVDVLCIMWGNKFNDEAQPFRPHLHIEDNNDRLIELLGALATSQIFLVPRKIPKFCFYWIIRM